MSRGSRFRFNNKSFAVWDVKRTDSNINYLCWEIDDDAFYNNYSVDIRKGEFEERLLNFFKLRDIHIKPQTFTEGLFKVFKETMLDLLSDNFEIKNEVCGEHFTGRKVKLDSVLIPKHNAEWRNKNLVFGIEFKNPLVNEVNNRRDEDMLAQCLDYAFSTFNNFPDIVILLCPLFPALRDERKLLKFLSTYNLGYIDYHKDEVCFKLGLQTFWSENHQASYLLKQSELKKKYGNRGYKAS